MRRGLGACYAAAHPEVVRELAGHLEEVYEDLVRRGLPTETAERRSLAQVSDWLRLKRDLERAKEGEVMRNQQIRAVWLPGLLTTIAAFGFLRAIIAVGALPWWIHQGRLSELLHQPMLQTELCLFVIQWVVALPLAGAAGAFASWRAGGRPLQRVLAALFPAMAIAGLVAIGVTIELVMAPVPNPRDGNSLFARLMLATILWIWLPAISLLLGSLPFTRLRALSPQQA